MKLFAFFIAVFTVVMLLNQISYGSCFESYCISSALPKVILISAIITAVIYFLKKTDHKAPNNDSSANDSNSSVDNWDSPVNENAPGINLILIIGVVIFIALGKVAISNSNFFKTEAQIEHEKCVEQIGHANRC
jgi:hypothetical protein